MLEAFDSLSRQLPGRERFKGLVDILTERVKASEATQVCPVFRFFLHSLVCRDVTSARFMALGIPSLLALP